MINRKDVKTKTLKKHHHNEEKTPCLATKKLYNYTLVPFQVVPPVLTCRLHLHMFFIISCCFSITPLQSQHQHLLHLDLLSTSILSFQFCSGSLLGLCTLIVKDYGDYSFYSGFLAFLLFSHASYLFVSPCSHSSNFETNS